jgi:hypothetical protein
VQIATEKLEKRRKVVKSRAGISSIFRANGEWWFLLLLTYIACSIGQEGTAIDVAGCS